MRRFDHQAIEDLAALLAGREPRFVSERWLEPGTMLWTRESIPVVLVAPNVLAALQNALGVEHAVQARQARALETARRGEARVRA
jgi:hypothetical protein